MFVQYMMTRLGKLPRIHGITIYRQFLINHLQTTEKLYEWKHFECLIYSSQASFLASSESTEVNKFVVDR